MLEYESGTYVLKGSSPRLTIDNLIYQIRMPRIDSRTGYYYKIATEIQ